MKPKHPVCRLSSAVLILAGILVMAAVLPRLFDFTFKDGISSPFVLYSTLSREFYIAENRAGTPPRYQSASGVRVDKKTYELRTPLFWYRDVYRWGGMPGKIDGEAITREKIERNRQMFRFRPGDMKNAGIGLWPLFESASDFSDLAIPETMFHAQGTLVFVDGQTRRPDADMTDRVAAAMKRAGFRYPVDTVWGNATTRKAP